VFDDSSLYLVNPDETDLQQMPGTFRSEHLSWSPGGSRLALDQGGGEFPPRNVFVLDLGGSRPQQVTDAGAYEITPAWSPDGSVIAFSSSRCCDTENSHGNNYELYIVDPSTGWVVRLTHTEGLQEVSPAWSPDGTRIAYSASANAPAHLYVMGADGSNARQITEGELWDNGPSWSPDGTRIAFVSELEDHSEIDVVNADGTGRRTLLDCSNPCIYIRDAVWSPDGTTILFSENRGDPGVHLRSYLELLDVETGAVRGLDVGSLSACCAAWEAVPRMESGGRVGS